MEEAKTARILVVDDERMNLEVLEGILESLGHCCICADSANGCYERIADDIDLILMDIMMPGTDGFEAVRYIRNCTAFFDLPIIMVTSLSSNQDRLIAVECGANDFITKPVDKTELRIRVSALLKLKLAQDAIKQHQSALEKRVTERTS